MTQSSDPGPAELIERSGKTLLVLAVESGTSIPTVLRAKQTNAWPTQHRTRDGLRRALGLPPAVPSAAQPSPVLPSAQGEG